MRWMPSRSGAFASSGWSERSPRPGDASETRTIRAVERFFSRIPENSDRVLRVAVNTESDPWLGPLARGDHVLR